METGTNPSPGLSGLAPSPKGSSRCHWGRKEGREGGVPVWGRRWDVSGPTRSTRHDWRRQLSEYGRGALPRGVGPSLPDLSTNRRHFVINGGIGPETPDRGWFPREVLFTLFPSTGHRYPTGTWVLGVSSEVGPRYSPSSFDSGGPGDGKEPLRDEVRGVDSPVPRHHPESRRT